MYKNGLGAAQCLPNIIEMEEQDARARPRNNWQKLLWESEQRQQEKQEEEAARKQQLGPRGRFRAVRAPTALALLAGGAG